MPVVCTRTFIICTEYDCYAMAVCLCVFDARLPMMWMRACNACNIYADKTAIAAMRRQTHTHTHIPYICLATIEFSYEITVGASGIHQEILVCCRVYISGDSNQPVLFTGPVQTIFLFCMNLKIFEYRHHNCRCIFPASHVGLSQWQCICISLFDKKWNKNVTDIWLCPQQFSICSYWSWTVQQPVKLRYPN